MMEEMHERENELKSLTLRVQGTHASEAEAKISSI